MEDLIIFQRSFWRCWLHAVICQLSGVRFWPRAEAHVELIWQALDGTPASVWAPKLLLLIWLLLQDHTNWSILFTLKLSAGSLLGCEAVATIPADQEPTVRLHQPLYSRGWSLWKIQLFYACNAIIMYPWLFKSLPLTLTVKSRYRKPGYFYGFQWTNTWPSLEGRNACKVQQGASHVLIVQSAHDGDFRFLLIQLRMQHY